jgi:DNA-binding NarL/FixJ family response regulator
MAQPNPAADIPDERDEPPPTLRWPKSPVATPTDRLWSAAMDADATGGTEGGRSNAWDDLVSGRMRIWYASTTAARCYLLARVTEPRERRGRELNASEGTIVARVLSGEQQKVLACELAIAPSTVSNRFVRALARIDLSARVASLPLVILAQATVGAVRTRHPRSASFEHQGNRCLVLSVPRPIASRMARLTCAEREVAGMFIEGCSRPEIALRRKASVNTIGRQIHSIFSSLEVTGRYGLIRRAVELGCFE